MTTDAEFHSLRMDTSRANFAGCAILAVIGAVLIALVFTNGLSNYLQPVFKPWIALTGASLMALGLWTSLCLSSHAAHQIHEAHAESAGHEHRLHRTVYLLLVPLLLVLVALPAPLGSSLVNSAAVGGGQGTAPTAPSQSAVQRVQRNSDGTLAYPVLNDGVNELDLEELNSRYSFGSKSQLAGKQVKLVGFVAPDPNNSAVWRVSRFKIYCCAADAVPYVATVLGAAMPPADSWVEVTGTVEVSQSDGIVALSGVQVNPVKQPDSPYL
ncbi:TIGR03943 family putative permease subunit [Arcanobacterium hippocoleae]|uniref:TIGR03943 family putative permease subunit n=1 Tax=Arcanobacterium hippocoleae TaxID=149017 RepID=UPI003341D3E1